MKHKLRNALILSAAAISSITIWSIQASDQTPLDTLQITHDHMHHSFLKSDSMTYTMQIIHPDSLYKHAPKVDTLRYTPGTRDLLLRPADKAEYTVRDLLLRPEDQRRYAFIDTLRWNPTNQEKSK